MGKGRRKQRRKRREGSGQSISERSLTKGERMAIIITPEYLGEREGVSDSEIAVELRRQYKDTTIKRQDVYRIRKQLKESKKIKQKKLEQIKEIKEKKSEKRVLKISDLPERRRYRGNPTFYLKDIPEDRFSLNSTFLETLESDESPAGYWNPSGWVKHKKKRSSPTPKGTEVKAYLIEYKKKKLQPFFVGTADTKAKTTDFLIDPDHFKTTPEVDYLSESEDKLKALKLKGSTTVGNQIQIRVNERGEFEGFFYQSISGLKNPTPQFYRPKVMVLDPDPVGHFKASIIRDYSGETFKVIDSRGEETEIDDLMAYIGFAHNVTDTRGHKRAGEARKIIQEKFGESSLKYMKGGVQPSDVAVSDQQIAVITEIYSPKILIQVTTAERKEIPFKKTMEDIPDPVEPRLVFEPKPGETLRPVNSDDIMKAAVRKMKIEGMTVQAMLNALYDQKWINYPRSNLVKAEDDPIHILGSNGEKLKAKEARDRVEGKGKWEDKGFKGSVQGRQLLDIIVKSHESYEREENFITTGEWVLYSRDYEIARTSDTLFEGEDRDYSSDKLDISFAERGITEEKMVDFILEEHLVTPATQWKFLKQLQESGIVVKREGRYVTDRRGLVLYAVNEFYDGARVDKGVKEKKFERVHELKQEILQGKTKKEVNRIASRFDMLTEQDKNDMRAYLDIRVEELLEIEQDLAELDSF